MFDRIDSSGNGSGDGHGDGYGRGHGHGDGRGNGDGDGYGRGRGDGAKIKNLIEINNNYPYNSCCYFNTTDKTWYIQLGCYLRE